MMMMMMVISSSLMAVRVRTDGANINSDVIASRINFHAVGKCSRLLYSGGANSNKQIL